ncbi:MAG: NAD-dependent epimerase/dehydratase family protein, partial [Acidimicrobiia bacterium]
MSASSDGLTGTRVIVLGGAGFVGSHLCERLLACGADVVCLDNLMTGTEQNTEHLAGERLPVINHDNREHISVDGTVDYVFNFVSPASPVDFERWPIQFLEIGAIGTHNAL